MCHWAEARAQRAGLAHLEILPPENQLRDGLTQTVRCEGFIEVRLQCPHVLFRIEEAVGVSGEIQHLEIGVKKTETSGKLVPHHFRHDLVGDEQVERRRLGLERLWTAVRFVNVAVLDETALHKRAHPRFIVNHENFQACLRHRRHDACRSSSARRSIHRYKERRLMPSNLAASVLFPPESFKTRLICAR